MRRHRSSTLDAFEKKLRDEIMRLRVRGIARREIRAILRRTELEVQGTLRNAFHKTR